MSHPHRFHRTPLAAALGVALLPLVASPVQAQLEEVVVTATKRTESLQDVPISVSALSGDSMRELGVQTFDEYVEFLPNVVSAGNWSGSTRNLHSGIRLENGRPSRLRLLKVLRPAALYFDEMPVSFGAHVIWMSTQPISNVSRSCLAPRERYSAPARSLETCV